MPYQVLFLEGSVKDIESIYQYIRKSGNKQAAKNMFQTIREACQSLSENPQRGSTPKEISQLGQFEYRQIIIKNYRIIYQVSKPNVYIYGIIHGNRNVETVLRQRLLI